MSNCKSPGKSPSGRRGFLKGAAAGAAALVTQSPVKAQAPDTRRNVVVPSATALAKETEPVAADVEVLTADRPGSDFMVDVLKSLGFEYVCANPGSSFRALHESIINYGGNKAPELITCCHEEQSVAMADGYAKIEGKPLAVMAHSTVGLQHAAMAIYNAYAGRSPAFIILGNTIDATARRPLIEWYHSAQDAVAMVRDYSKWDDLPISLPHFAESAVRAYKLAVTPPMGPVILVADSDLQETPVDANLKLHIPKYTASGPPAGDSASVAAVAKLLVNAENPVIFADRCVRTEAGQALLVELAETLQAPVVGGKFPNHHPLSQAGGRALIANADLIVGLEVPDLWGTVNTVRDQLHRSAQTFIKPTTKVVSISALELGMKSNYQYFQRYPETEISIVADAEAMLPYLIEACKRLLTADRKRAFEDRGKKLAAAHEQGMQRARDEATYGWDSSPISLARLQAELYDVIRTKDWSLVGGGASRLWNVDKIYRTAGGGGAAGVGYTAPGSVGGALANRKHGRLSVAIQTDGDLMYAPGALWTAAHHRIPLLSVMHNNRAYHQEVMHVQRMANRHQRGIENAGIGTTITDPNIDFATVARGLGVHGEGPITETKDLGPAIRRALDAVERSGGPALVDVVTQPR
ncbi:MAG TPA: thiamine pyrophosphate-binding protein [Bryobacteraceae bacterium]|nr:thiamine pyrophosphate-binding protein [Bryobacteraceae bacterium]